MFVCGFVSFSIMLVRIYVMRNTHALHIDDLFSVFLSEQVSLCFIERNGNKMDTTRGYTLVFSWPTRNGNAEKKLRERERENNAKQ